MYAIKLVGMTESEHETLFEALIAFIVVEDSEKSYGNRFIKCPDGKTINVWDIEAY